LHKHLHNIISSSYQSPYTHTAANAPLAVSASHQFAAVHIFSNPFVLYAKTAHAQF